MAAPIFSTLSAQARAELVSDINGGKDLDDANKKIVSGWLSFYDELIAKLNSPGTNIKEIRYLLGLAQERIKKLQQTH
jgi:hypothetical protein